MSQKACASCGKPLAKDDLFCRNCGSAVNTETTEESATHPSPLSSPQPNTEHSKNTSSRQPENGVLTSPDLGGGKTIQAGTDAGQTTEQMKNDLRGWGLLMIFWGILSLIFTKYLDPVWGIIIIVLGIVNLLVIKRFMFVVNGISLFFVGAFNIIATLVTISSSGISSFWLATGIMQIVWGFQEMTKYGKFSPWRGFFAFPLGAGGAVGRFAVIPVERKMIEDASGVSREKLNRFIERLARFWLDEGRPSQAEILISGFDDDGRELHEIPEVCDWAKRAVNEFPVLPYFLTPTSLDRLTGWLCGPVSGDFTRTEGFSQRFSQTRNTCLNRAILEAPAYFNHLGARQSTFENIHRALVSGEYQVEQVNKGGHVYTAAVRSKREMRKYRRSLPWRSARQAPLLFILGLLFACVIITGAFFISMRLIYGSPQPLFKIPTLGKPGIASSTEVGQKICWTDELSNFNGNRSQLWDDYLKEDIKAQISFTQFKDEVVAHNPVLATDGYIFYSQKTYLLPEPCR